MRLSGPTVRSVAVLAALAMVLLLAACASAQAAQSTAAPASQPAATPKPAVTTSLFVTADIVQGTKNIPQDQAAAKTCVVSSRYPRNAELVFRARVEDPTTGEPMDDKALSGVEFRLGDGKTVLKGTYGKHGDESFWSSSWVIPKDFPTGTLNYSVVATSTDGRTGQFKPFNVPPSLLTVSNEVLPDVAPPEKKS